MNNRAIGNLYQKNVTIDIDAHNENRIMMGNLTVFIFVATHALGTCGSKSNCMFCSEKKIDETKVHNPAIVFSIDLPICQIRPYMELSPKAISP